MHWFVARGTGQSASWLGEDAPQQDAPQINLKRLASRYLHSVVHGSVTFDVFCDDAQRPWYVAGVTTPSIDDRGRRDNELIAFLVRWEEIADFFPVDHAKVIRFLLGQRQTVRQPVDAEELERLGDSFPQGMSLERKAKFNIEAAKPFLSRVARGAGAQVHWAQCHWPFLSFALSQFPVGFCCGLGITVTDSTLPHSVATIAVLTKSDPQHEESLTGADADPPRPLTGGPHPYLEWLSGREADLDSWPEAVCRECDLLFLNGRSTLWPKDAAGDLLQMLGNILLKSNGSALRDPVRAREIQAVLKRHPKVPFAPPVLEAYLLPACDEIVERLLDGDDKRIREVDIELVADPALRCLYGLWFGQKEYVCSDTLTTLESELSEASRERIARQRPEILLQPWVPGRCSQRLVSWLVQPDVLSELHHDVREELAEVVVRQHEDGLGQSGPALLRLISVWPDDADEGRFSPLQQQLRDGHVDFAVRCVGIITGELSPTAATIVLRELDQKQAWLPVLLLALADLRGCDLASVLAAARVDDDPDWMLRRALLLTGRLLSLCQPAAGDDRESEADEPANLCELRRRTATAFRGSGWMNWLDRGKSPRSVALRRLPRLVRDAAAFRDDRQMWGIRDELLQDSVLADEEWRTMRSLARAYLFGWRPDLAAARTHLTDMVEKATADRLRQWVDGAAESTGDIMLAAPPPTPSPLLLQLTINCVRAGSVPNGNRRQMRQTDVIP